MAKYGINQNTPYGQAMQERDAWSRRMMYQNAIRGAAIVGGPMAAAYAIPAMAGGGAVAGGAGAASAGTAAGTGTAAGGSVAAGSSIPWMAVGSKGVDTLFGVYANRQQMKGNREALAYQRQADERAMQIEADERAEMKRQFDIQQAQLQRQWEAQQKFEADKFAASEEERLYSRRLQDEKEARRAPYRAASAAALDRIGGIINSGRTSPGLGSLGSYRR